MQNSWRRSSIFFPWNYLEFELLTETEVNIYTGKGKTDTADEGGFNMSQLRLIQRFPDEFSRIITGTL